MEDFGIGGAARMALQVLEHGSRRTGRTSRLIERVQAGDRIIVATDAEASRLRRLLHIAGKEDVSVRVCPPNREERAWDAGTNPTGITLFETSWVEQWYACRIERAQRDFGELQAALSKDKVAPCAEDFGSERFGRYRPFDLR